MATLYVENFPDDLYEALRKRARQNRSSIAAETIAVIKDAVPTAEELKRREEFYRFIRKMGKCKPPGPGPFPSTEEMVREDRER